MSYSAEEREWVNDNYPAYKEALKNLSDQHYVRGLLRGIEDKLQLVLSYNPREDNMHTAVFNIGAVQAKLERLLTDLDFVDDYEQRRKDLEEHESENAEPQDDGSHSGQLDEIGEL